MALKSIKMDRFERLESIEWIKTVILIVSIKLRSDRTRIVKESDVLEDFSDFLERMNFARRNHSFAFLKQSRRKMKN